MNVMRPKVASSYHALAIHEFSFINQMNHLVAQFDQSNRVH